MKTFFTALLLFHGIASVEGAAKNDFVPMFDGETLKAWEATPAKIAPAWTVQDGMIVGGFDTQVIRPQPVSSHCHPAPSTCLVRTVETCVQ